MYDPSSSDTCYLCSFSDASTRNIVSDNGKTFKDAAKFIHLIMNHNETRTHLSDLVVEWQFNVERAPWWGGVFEHMVGSTYKKMIGQAKLTYDELHTTVVEVEAILNSRLISHISVSDLDDPLTPSHLMLGRRLSSLPDNLCYKQSSDYT
jgi:hypothetical protein